MSVSLDLVGGGVGGIRVGGLIGINNYRLIAGIGTESASYNGDSGGSLLSYSMSYYGVEYMMENILSFGITYNKIKSVWADRTFTNGWTNLENGKYISISSDSYLFNSGYFELFMKLGFKNYKLFAAVSEPMKYKISSSGEIYDDEAEGVKIGLNIEYKLDF